MVYVAGIDEAGRGPVIGPLVTAGVMIDEDKLGQLVALGVKDSKLIAPAKREMMFDQVKKIVDKYEISIMSPQDIDNALADPSSNLNWLEADSTAHVINMLGPEKAIVDCPSTNIASYSDYLCNKLSCETELVVEHKADLNYVVVGAASILAKVTRDRAIEELKKKIGLNFGSGYPSDPMTKDFIAKYWNKYPDIFRKSWATYKKFSESGKQKGLGDY